MTFGLFHASSLQAQLTWDHYEVSQEATAFDAQKKFSFPFANRGDYSVTITSIISSCGCTTAKLTTDRYAPGETGEIEAVFDIGDRRGPQTKTLTVRTDDPRKPVTTLVVKLDIDEVIELQPRLLLWRKGEPRSSKTVEIIVHRPDLLALQGAESSEPHFNISWPPEAPESPQPAEGLRGEEEAGADEIAGNDEPLAETIEPVIYRVMVSPPVDGPAHSAVLTLLPEDELPEEVALPQLVIRTLGPPASSN